MRKPTLTILFVGLSLVAPSFIAADRAARTERARTKTSSSASTGEPRDNADRFLARLERHLGLRLWLQLRALGLIVGPSIGTHVIDGPDPVGNSDEGDDGSSGDDEERPEASPPGTIGGKSEGMPSTKD